jgi:hypothetical protein
LDETVGEEKFVENSLPHAAGVAAAGHVAFDAKEPASGVGATVVGAVSLAGDFANEAIHLGN